MKKVSTFTLGISMIGLLLGNIASILAIDRIYNSFDLVSLINTEKASLTILLVLAIVGGVISIAHLVYVLIKKKYSYLVYSLSSVVGFVFTALTEPFTLPKTIGLLNGSIGKSNTLVVNAIASFGTLICILLLIVSLVLSLISMEKEKEIVSSNGETIKTIEENKEETVAEEVKEEEEKETSIEEEKKDMEEEVKVEESAQKKSTAKIYHVVKRKEDNKWTVKLASGEKVIKTFNTKEEALAYSSSLAERQNASLRVHASKGKSKGKIQKNQNY